MTLLHVVLLISFIAVFLGKQTTKTSKLTQLRLADATLSVSALDSESCLCSGIFYRIFLCSLIVFIFIALICMYFTDLMNFRVFFILLLFSLT